MKVPVSAVKKIAIFRALQLGDLLCAIPALRALHYAYPDAKITLLGMPWAQSLTTRFPGYIHSFVHFPGYPALPEQVFTPQQFASFLCAMQQQEFDLVFQMQGNGSIVNPMVELLGGKHTAGFCLPNDYCPDANLFLRYPEGIHEIERHLALMNYLGIESQGTHLEFPLYKKDHEEYAQLPFSLQPQQYVCVHPGSRGAWRQWPPEHFAALANYCADQGLTIVLTGMKDEMNIVEKVCRHLKKKPVIAAGETSLGALALVIKNALLLISNCTGVSHIAAAMETPGIIISMDGEPARWGPLDKKLYHTIDWTRDTDFDHALSALKDLVSNSLQRDHVGDSSNSTVLPAGKQFADSK